MYLSLIKVFFKESFSFKRLFGFNLKQSKAKVIGFSLLMLYAFGVFFASFGFMFFDLAKLMSEIDQLEIIISFAATYTFGLSVMMALLRSSGYIFNYKDYDILAPLPIKNSTVLFAKLSVMLLMIYITSLLFVIPIFAAYFYYHSISFFGLVYAILGFLFTPLIPIVLLSFVSLLITKLTNKLPFSKLLNIILMFGLFIGIFALSFVFTGTETNPLTGQVDLIGGVSEYYPLVRYYAEAVHDHNHLSFLLLAGISIGAFVVYVFLIQGLVRKTNQSKQNTYINRKKKVTYNSGSMRKTLIQKEFKTFFSIPIYVLNTGLGVIIIFALSVASLIFKSNINEFLVEATELSLPILPLLLIVFGFSIAMTFTPAINLSLEGKHLWILKTLPVDPYEVMLSKILFNVLLVVPVSVVGITMLSYSLEFEFIEIALFLLVVCSFSMLSSILFGFINLYFPKFEFNSEVEVIKQSIGSFLAVFGGFALLITFGFMYYFLTKVLVSEWALLIIGLTMVLATYGLLVLLKPVSRKKFLTY